MSNSLFESIPTIVCSMRNKMVYLWWTALFISINFLVSASSKTLPSLEELNERFQQDNVRYRRSADCVDLSVYCSTYKNYCKDSDYQEYLKKECKKTCDFCPKPCVDKFHNCDSFKTVCSKPQFKKSVKHWCEMTCGFCKVPTTTQPPTTQPRTEKPIVHADVKCGTKGKGNTRIVGGTRAKKGAWPWQITMNYKNNKYASTPHWCGGSVIAPNWIVTAAHCFVYSSSPQDYTITIGEHDLNDTDGYEQRIPIEKIIKHPFYNAYKQDDYDIALLKMKSNITYNDRVRPVCLPTQSFPAGTANCYISGWGHLQESGHGPWVLHQAKVPLVSRQTCQKSYDDLRYTLTPRMRCAGYGKGGIDACQGDSGGPLVCKTPSDIWELVGLVSWGIGCARKGRYGVYSNMEDLKYWVQGTVHSY